MITRSRWLLLPVALTLFGILSLNHSSIFSSYRRSVYGNGFVVHSDQLTVTNAPVNRHIKNSVKLFAATRFFNMPVTNQRFLGHCSVKENCRIINDDIHSADAVLYHGPDFDDYYQDIQDNQIAVLWFLESPISYRPSNKLKDRINWTMTYRQDSDIPLPYGIFKAATEPIQIDFEQIWSSKNASTVWLISNCAYRNARLQLVDALKKHGLKIDVFGSCGRKTPNNCDGVNKQSDDCVVELFRPYKFAISFENSLCQDYVTEKFYELLQKRYGVPIVMQRRRYLEIGAPNNSFISVDDFDNLADLVSYLQIVENNKEKYLQYHLWRKYYIVQSDYFSIEETGFCALCKKLIANNYSAKNYDNPFKWHYQDACEHPQDGFVKKYLH